VRVLEWHIVRSALARVIPEIDVLLLYLKAAQPARIRVLSQPRWGANDPAGFACVVRAGDENRVFA